MYIPEDKFPNKIVTPESLLFAEVRGAVCWGMKKWLKNLKNTVVKEKEDKEREGQNMRTGVNCDVSINEV